MPHEIVNYLIAVALNLGGMVPIYCAMSGALAQSAWRGTGTLRTLFLIGFGQLFWIAPAMLVIGHRSGDRAGAGVFWFANWLVGGFAIVLMSKSAARIPRSLGETARLDGLGGFSRWRRTVLPFVSRDLAFIMFFTVMATVIPSWGLISLRQANGMNPMFDGMSGLGEQLGWMAGTSVLGAIPLIAIFFAAKKPA